LGCSTIPDLLEILVIIHRARRLSMPVREQNPYQHPQEEEERKELPQQRDPRGELR
jgi:hypothetical protein